MIVTLELSCLVLSSPVPSCLVRLNYFLSPLLKVTLVLSRQVRSRQVKPRHVLSGKISGILKGFQGSRNWKLFCLIILDFILQLLDILGFGAFVGHTEDTNIGIHTDTGFV